MVVRTSSGFAWSFAALALAATGSIARPALGNGRFPASGQIAITGDDDAHLAVRTTFGLVVSNDAAATWSWVCEPAVGYSGQEDPAIAWASESAIVAATSEGLSASSDHGCAFAFAVPDESMVDVAALGDRALAVSRKGANAPAAFTSSDGGATWVRAGEFPLAFVPATIELAPSDPLRVYASGSLFGASQKAVLFVSTDGAASFEMHEIPTATSADVPYVSAVDPLDAARVYLRIDGQAEDTLAVSSDGGGSFETLFVAPSPLLGFALSPDGTELAVGGKDLGVWTGPSSSEALTKVSEVGAKCLRWTDKGLYACGDEARDGFTVGLSIDAGRSFVPSFHLSQLCGPLACEAGSSVSEECASAWPAQRELLGVVACGVVSSTSSTSSSGGSASPSGGSCDCAASARASGLASPWLAAFALALLAARRRKH